MNKRTYKDEDKMNELSPVHDLPPRRCGRSAPKARHWTPRKLRGNELLTEPRDRDRLGHIPASPTEHFGITSRRTGGVTGR